MGYSLVGTAAAVEALLAEDDRTALRSCSRRGRRVLVQRPQHREEVAGLLAWATQQGLRLVPRELLSGLLILIAELVLRGTATVSLSFPEKVLLDLYPLFLIVVAHVYGVEDILAIEPQKRSTIAQGYAALPQLEDARSVELAERSSIAEVITVVERLRNVAHVKEPLHARVRYQRLVLRSITLWRQIAELGLIKSREKQLRVLRSPH